jgi:hypothetical protein
MMYLTPDFLQLNKRRSSDSGPVFARDAANRKIIYNFTFQCYQKECYWMYFEYMTGLIPASWPGYLKRLAAAAFTVLVSVPFLGMSVSHPDKDNFNKKLPVKITILTAKYSAARQVVSLHWVTTMEKSNEHFAIERSLDSIHFVVIGKARSVGNSHVPQHYYFDDPRPVGGKMYYRLREVDSSGNQFLTTVVSAFKPITKLELTGVHSSDSGMELDFVVISPEVSSANVVVADIAGHVWKSYFMKMKKGANLQSIYTGDLKPGIYFLQVNDRSGNGSVMGKFTHKASGKR